MNTGGDSARTTRYVFVMAAKEHTRQSKYIAMVTGSRTVFDEKRESMTYYTISYDCWCYEMALYVFIIVLHWLYITRAMDDDRSGKS